MEDHMKRFSNARSAGCFLLLVLAMLVTVPTYAQTDFSGEWALRDNEVFESQGQPPLGDFCLSG
jgi:hypothetical protein